MKRREFLATPALGAMLPVAGLGAFDVFAPPPSPVQKSNLEGSQVEQRMHQDFVTFFPGIEYFYLGNGDIEGAIQYCPKDPRGSFLGFTFMDPEHFCRKWSTFLYHPEHGLSSTRVGVSLGDTHAGRDAASGMYTGVKGYSVNPETFRSIQWKYPDGVPTVSLLWSAGECEVEEEFFVPNAGALLFRRVNVRNLSDRPFDVNLSLSLYANFGLFDEIATDEKTKTAHAAGLSSMCLTSLDAHVGVAGRYDVRIGLGVLQPKSKGVATYVYAIKGGEKLLKGKSVDALLAGTRKYWATKSTFTSGNPTADHLFAVSRSCLKAVIARSGKMDAGTWMYNMEWVSDQGMAIEAMVRLGFLAEARVMLENNLARSIGSDGRTIESSRWFGYDYTEIDQNGILLYGIWAYLSWTGDFELVRKYWDKIVLCAEFPLRKEFRDPVTKMVKNKREFWERSDIHGVESGYELAYQFWISFGLEKGALIAEALGKKAKAKVWRQAAEDMKTTMLTDPRFRLIEDDHFIKRRTAAGAWQQYFIPPDRNRMPPGSPIATGAKPSADPDSVEVYPIIHEMIDPRGDLSVNTLKWVEQMWNQRWATGGYPRYNVESEDNPPAPWAIPSMLIARAYAEAGDDEKVWRVLNWLNDIHGGLSGGWFERYAQSITPPMPPVGVVGWIWYEIAALFIQHVVGIRPELDRLVIKPRLLRGMDVTRMSCTVRGTPLEVIVRRTAGGEKATINGKEKTMTHGAMVLPYPLGKRTLTIELHV